MPIITDVGSGQLVPSVVGATPVTAVWYYSADDIDPYIETDSTVWGFTYDASPMPGFYKVRGVDGLSFPVTDFSAPYDVV